MKKLELHNDVRKKLIGDLRNYFQEERGEDIGDLAGMLLLDFIIENIGPHFYNQGIKDAAVNMRERVDELMDLEIV